MFQQIQFEACHRLSYCSQYCREVHWTLNHSLFCQFTNSVRKKEEATTIGRKINESSAILQGHHEDNKTISMSYNSAFEILPVKVPHPIFEAEAEITNELRYPSSSSTSTSKKKSLKTLVTSPC